MAIVRRARPEDAEEIHHSHMRSIQEICAKDYSEKDILAWGHRAFQKESRLRAIENHHVWVVDVDRKVQGYAHLEMEEKNGFMLGHVWGLYVTPEVQGQGFGVELCHHILTTAKAAGVEVLRLEATVTAHGFYKKLGFRDAGPPMTVNVNGAAIRCIPMAIRFSNFDPGNPLA